MRNEGQGWFDLIWEGPTNTTTLRVIGRLREGQTGTIAQHRSASHCQASRDRTRHNLAWHCIAQHGIQSA
eukprot:4013310-Pyramimonas_sp.AAC.1